MGSGGWKQSQVPKSDPPLSKAHSHVSSGAGLLRTRGSRVQAAPAPLCHPSQARPSHVAGTFGCCDAEQPATHLCASERPKGFRQSGIFWQTAIGHHHFSKLLLIECLHQTVFLPSAVLYTHHRDDSLETAACQSPGFRCRQPAMYLTCQTV